MVGCNTKTLTPYSPSTEQPWNKSRILHLYRRLGHSASLNEIESALATDPQTLIDQIIDDALQQPPIEPPEWGEWNLLDFEDFDSQLELFIEWRPQWIKDIYEKGFREKMAVFWSNHFVTQFQGYLCAPAGYKYLVCLQQNALGNFREFVRKIGIEGAMLIYLNGAESTRVNPNENYARELYELFTLGRDNGYTQNDITETARALTGYVVVPCPQVTFISGIWDSGEKTIFGRTGNWGYDDVIDILFEEKAELIAQFICRKIYSQFVNAGKVDDQVINDLANELLAADFELAPMLRTLFKSEHFFADEVIGTQIKSPLETTLNLWRELGLRITEESLRPLTDVSDFLGQVLFQPPNVAGWPGHHSWISSSFLRTRWQVIYLYIVTVYDEDPEVFRSLAKTLSDDANDPAIISRAIVDHFTPRGFQDEMVYERATATFKSDIPEGYYTSGSWDLNWDEAPLQVALLLLFLTRQPEYQLI